jgi:hypothetical protein
MEATRHVYCSTCRRQVRIVSTASPLVLDGHANIPDARNICLDYGEGCERGRAPGEPGDGVRCPVFRTSPRVMGLERARAGLSPEPRVMIAVLCEMCGVETSQERVGATDAVCEICGTPNVLPRRER